MLIEMGIISRDETGLFSINSMIIDLRNVKMKAESRTVIKTEENTLISKNCTEK